MAQGAVAVIDGLRHMEIMRHVYVARSQCCWTGHGGFFTAYGGRGRGGRK